MIWRHASVTRLDEHTQIRRRIPSPLTTISTSPSLVLPKQENSHQFVPLSIDKRINQRPWTIGLLFELTVYDDGERKKSAKQSLERVLKLVWKCVEIDWKSWTTNLMISVVSKKEKAHVWNVCVCWSFKLSFINLSIQKTPTHASILHPNRWNYRLVEPQPLEHIVNAIEWKMF